MAETRGAEKAGTTKTRGNGSTPEHRGSAATAMTDNDSQRDNATVWTDMQLPAATPDAHGAIVVIR